MTREFGSPITVAFYRAAARQFSSQATLLAYLLLVIQLSVTVVASVASADCAPVFAPTERVAGQVKLSQTSGGLRGYGYREPTLGRFGSGVASLGDLDGDSVPDLAVGAPSGRSATAGVPSYEGSLYIVFLRADGTARANLKLPDSRDDDSGFIGDIEDGDEFGASVTALGDLDGDGVRDLAVGAPGDAGPDGLTLARGAVWIVFMKRDGRVKALHKIEPATAEFDASLDGDDRFGSAGAAVGDLDGDGVTELAVGTRGHHSESDGSQPGVRQGSVYLLFLRRDGSVKRSILINHPRGDVRGVGFAGDAFGAALAPLGDLDGNGYGELAVGAPNFDEASSFDGGDDSGSVWLLFLGADGVVAKSVRISNAAGMDAELHQLAFFGTGLANVGDIDGDGACELAVGATDKAFRTGEIGGGRAWFLFLDSTGTVRETSILDTGYANFRGVLDDGDLFGSGIAALGDVNGDGIGDLAVGTPGDDDSIEGYQELGATWILRMEDPEDPGAICGDPTLDGHVRAADAFTVLRAALELGSCRPCECDVNDDGSVRATDAAAVLAEAVGASTTLECEPCF